jgi:hypothetical protein
MNPRRGLLPFPKKREKIFGAGIHAPHDRNARARIKARAMHLSRYGARAKGAHYGPLTPKAVDVCAGLLGLTDAVGLCVPSYGQIGYAARCGRGTVKPALDALEAAGLLSVVNRLVRARVLEPDELTGRPVWRRRVLRTTNSYVLHDPMRPGRPANVRVSKYENRPGDENQLSLSAVSPLEKALASIQKTWAARERPPDG